MYQLLFLCTKITHIWNYCIHIDILKTSSLKLNQTIPLNAWPCGFGPMFYSLCLRYQNNPLRVAKCQYCIYLRLKFPRYHHFFKPVLKTCYLRVSLLNFSSSSWRHAVGTYDLSLCFTLPHFSFNIIVLFKSLELVTRTEKSKWLDFFLTSIFCISTTPRLTFLFAFSL